jgi:integrase
VFPAPEGGYLSLDNFRTREWYDALDAAGIKRRGPYHLRHIATEALAAGVSIFEWRASWAPR